ANAGDLEIIEPAGAVNDDIVTAAKLCGGKHLPHRTGSDVSVEKAGGLKFITGCCRAEVAVNHLRIGQVAPERQGFTHGFIHSGAAGFQQYISVTTAYTGGGEGKEAKT